MMSTADAILALVGSVLCAFAGRVASYPSSPVYGRLQRNAVSYPGSGTHSDANYYAVLRDATFGGGSAQAAASPDWGQFLPAPWTGPEAYGAGGMGAVAPVMPVVAGPQYDDYADEYDAGLPAGVEFQAAPNFGFDWYGAQGAQPSLLQQQQQQQQQLEQEEMQEAAVFKDLLANYLTKKSNGASPSERDADRRTASAKKYVPAGVQPTSTTAKPNVAATVAAGEKAESAARVPAAAVTSRPQPTASSLPASSSRLAEKAAPVRQEGGQKEYAMFRPVGTAESRRPPFWPGAAKQTNSGPGAAGHGKVTRSRFGRFADDSLTEELDQLKAQ